jgi:hypothetical protein
MRAIRRISVRNSLGNCVRHSETVLKKAVAVSINEAWQFV